MSSSWWIEEVVYAGAEHLDEAYVAGYEAKAGYEPAEDVTALLRQGIGPDSTVVDLGAGTGRFVVDIAPLVGRVIAVDVSPAMAAQLRRRVAGAGLDNVTVVEAGFLSYEHDGSPVDAVFTRNALHQLPDFWKGVALRRIASLLAPGGVLRVRDLIYDIELDEVDEFMADWFSGAVDDPAKGWTSDELAEHVRIEFSTFRWLFEPLLDHAGFDVLDVEYVRRAYGAYTCRKR